MRNSLFRAVGVCCAAVAIAAGVAAPAVAAPAGNPLAGLTADQIAAKAYTDLQSASSVHFYGSSREDGQSVTVSLTLTQRGCLAYLGLGNGLSMTILQIGDSSWVKPNNAMWKSFGYTGSQLLSLEGKWLESSASGALPVGSGSSDTCDLKGFLSGFPPTGWVKVKSLTVHGKRALQLFNDAKKKQNQGYIDVSVSARPEILEVSGDGAPTYFGDYNVPVTLTPPPAKDVLTVLPPPKR
jgi:hypothetical protein